MPVIYALLCGMVLYLAILLMFSRRLPCSRRAMTLGSLGLALAFAMLSLSTSGVLVHGTHRTLTRIGFLTYGLSLAFTLGRYWLDAWQARAR